MSKDKETPPRTRGRLEQPNRFGQSFRNTPADAGKTSVGITLELLDEKHPRGRGEDLLCSLLSCGLTETPPRTRGRLCLDMFCSVPFGNTPADAGKTVYSDVPYASRQKHPRGRGEDLRYSIRFQACRETPPRTRGRPTCDTA